MSEPPGASANDPSRALRILVVEDDDADYQRLLDELARAGLAAGCHRVEDAHTFREALAEGSWDVVIAAYLNPSLNGLAALRLLQEQGLDIPLLLVSSKAGEEAAVEAMKAGARDYLTKDRLHRLAPAIEREVREVRLRRERNRLEEDLRQIQKMEAIGRLAGGIAHDFNNLLTAIRGYAALALSELPADHTVRADVEEIRRAADRATELTSQLLAFSRRQIAAPRILDLNDLVVRTEYLLRRLIGEHIELTTVLVPEPAHVRADPGQLEQVLMNLAINARDAMPNGGRLLLETRLVDLEERVRDRHGEVAAGRYVLLSVGDTGTGMDAETRARAFDPFFTTKPAGQGTGLGLATVYGIVTQNDGYVWLYSEPGQGTVFRIYLPRVPAPETVRPAAAAVAAAGGSERILLVEDEAGVRALVREVLQRRGYEVVAAADPASALEAARDASAGFALVVTDMVMPGMSGTELVRRLKASLPDVRVLYMSGYAEDLTGRTSAVEGGAAYLQKPFSPDALSRTVREVLDAPVR